MPELKKAGLVEETVYLASPIRVKQHGQPHRGIATGLGMYTAFTKSVTGSNNTTVRLDDGNEPQSDVLVWVGNLRNVF